MAFTVSDLRLFISGSFHILSSRKIQESQRKNREQEAEGINRAVSALIVFPK